MRRGPAPGPLGRGAFFNSRVRVRPSILPKWRAIRPAQTVLRGVYSCAFAAPGKLDKEAPRRQSGRGRKCRRGALRPPGHSPGEAAKACSISDYAHPIRWRQVKYMGKHIASASPMRACNTRSATRPRCRLPPPHRYADGSWVRALQRLSSRRAATNHLHFRAGTAPQRRSYGQARNAPSDDIGRDQ
jgi:hypothetical protein